MLYSTRSKMILSFIGIALLVGGIALWIGSRLVSNAVSNEAMAQVRLDLNAAGEIYASRIREIRTAVHLLASGSALHASVDNRNVRSMIQPLRETAQLAELDFLGIVANDGSTLCRIGPDAFPAGKTPPNPIAALALKKQSEVYGTAVLDNNFLAYENPELAQKAKIAGQEADTGMALVAAVPISNSGKSYGVLYGGVLLNRNSEIIDRLRNTVFRHETYKGRSLGSIAIYLKDISITTSLLNSGGSRATETKPAADVIKSVLIEGSQSFGRAWMSSNWYLTGYQPIDDIFGQRIGMLSVGVLENKYSEIRSNALSLLMWSLLASMAVAVGLGYAFAHKIVQPIHKLIEASAQVSQGNLSPEIGPISKSEIGVLQKTFQKMLTSLQERDERQRAESESKLIQFEKQASVGKLAGGVAHEINNPLTGIITFTHLLLRHKNLPEDIRSDLETISAETERVRKIVKGLLDFSRQTELNRQPLDINRLCRSTIALMENQALIKNVNLNLELGEGLPLITLDQNQMESVLLNLVINALDATEPGGHITLSTGIGLSASNPVQKGIEIICRDTGSGIDPEHLNKIFDPFFTTKEVGKGTGLGLSVSYGIVARHGGTFHVQSKVGRGSTFTIWLPMEEQSTANENFSR